MAGAEASTTSAKPTVGARKRAARPADDEAEDGPSSERDFRRRDEDDEDDEDFDDAADEADGEDEQQDALDDEEEEPDSERPGRRRGEAAAKSAATPMPVIPLPVKELPKEPSLEERAATIEQRLAAQSADFLRAYNHGFDMSWVFHDTGLEGVIYTFEELQSAFRSLDVGPVDSNVVPIFHAIKRNQEAIALIRELVVDRKAPITVDLIRRIYVTLHPDEGDIKTVKYRRDIPQHRLYFHEYEAPDKIPLKLRALVDWLNAPESLKAAGPLKLAAKVHYDLAHIYPFPKDSGKVARLLMNLLLMRAGYPPAVMHHSERQRYYDALKTPSALLLVQMVRDAVENSISSIEKLLDDHRTRSLMS
ncbi:MAG: Fic family protein [Deltaproteobacteria bacterium]|nr:Fic family protein [Deltaproteobacteria bacterium]